MRRRGLAASSRLGPCSDPTATAAGWDIVKRVGPDHARTLLAVLELPDDQPWAFISSMYLREDGEALADVLADVEQDLTGKTRERMIAGLTAVL